MAHRPSLSIKRIQVGHWLTLQLAGWVSAETLPQLARSVDGVADQGVRELSLDFEQVMMLDSRGVGALVGWHRHFAKRDVDFRLLNVQGMPLNVLQVSNLNNLLNLGPRPSNVSVEVQQQHEALWGFFEHQCQLVDGLGEGILGLNAKGLILFAGAAAEKLIGVPESQLIGRPAIEVIQFTDQNDKAIPPESNPILAVAAGIVPTLHDEMRLKQASNGRFRPVMVNAKAIKTQDVPVGAIVGLRDITEWKRTEDGLRAAGRMEATATLAAGIAHTFNNLMVGVLGHAELLRVDFADDPAAVDSLEEISRTAKRAGELAQQLQAFARGGRRETRSISLNDTVRETLRLQEDSFPARIRFSRELDENLANVKADAAQMRQCLMSLVINAVEAIEGQGEVVIRTESVQLRSEREAAPLALPPGAYARLSVIDNGQGMDEETQARIFEPFYSTKALGRGLGLAATYGIIRAHGGAIDVDSHKDRGTTFQIYLPCESADSRPAGKTAPPEPAAGKRTAARDAIVIVIDDEQMVRSVTQAILERFGYRVLTAGSGLEALETLRRLEGPIDLAILDLAMPGLSGRETFQELKALRPDLRILICSGYQLDEAGRELLDSGANGFLQKPYLPEALRAAVEKALE